MQINDLLAEGARRLPCEYLTFGGAARRLTAEEIDLFLRLCLRREPDGER